jgi:hypothetical protein
VSEAVIRQTPQGAGRFTFRGNARDTRHGWLRLTPAYSLHLVRELAAQRHGRRSPVLDPFSGTGTTLLVCAEQGIPCDAIDLNPFLAWLARAKVAGYDEACIGRARRAVSAMARNARNGQRRDDWRPALHRIERWWDAPTLDALARARATLGRAELDRRAGDLARLAFCRALMTSSNASFRHQSMSFLAARRGSGAVRSQEVADALASAFSSVALGAASGLGRARRAVLTGDSRDVAAIVGERRYGAVITSPPYVNRMSYIRELRPYMYWLGFLADGRSAGELDWRAIGGTWGIATSNLTSWTAPAGTRSAHRGFAGILRRIEARSPILGRYVERYFVDLVAHVKSLAPVLEPGGEVHYIVGNSKFFDVLVPLERILAAELGRAGFSRGRIRTLRKRTSKPELYEYCVSATRDG